MIVSQLIKRCEKHIEDLITTNHSFEYIEANTYAIFGGKLGIIHIKTCIEEKMISMTNNKS